MFKMISRACVMAIALTTAHTAAAQQLVVDDTFAGYSFKWSGTHSILFRARPLIQDGQIFICGTYAFSGGSTRSKLARAVLKDAQAQMKGVTVRRNLTFFNSTSSRHFQTRLDGQPAACMAISADAGKYDLSSFEIKFRKGTYRVRK